MSLSDCLLADAAACPPSERPSVGLQLALFCGHDIVLAWKPQQCHDVLETGSPKLAPNEGLPVFKVAGISADQPCSNANTPTREDEWLIQTSWTLQD